MKFACAFFATVATLTLGTAAPALSVDEQRITQIASWLPAEPRAFGNRANDRESWNKLASISGAREIVTGAERMAREPIPELTDELYLDFLRTGNRTRCQNIMSARDRRVTAFALAECIEDKGRFIEPLCAIIREICKERAWVLPAHDAKLQNFNGTAFEPDLRATLVAWDLATCDYLLGDKLGTKTRQLIRENVDRRVLSPFKEMLEGKRPQVHWIRATHNWNAVCLAGVTGAALALEDSREERAFFVAAAEKGINSFLSGFTADGYCSEGLGYWNYGFGRYVMLAELVRQNTGGKLDLLLNPAARQPALYALRSEVIEGIYPSVADCSPKTSPNRELVWYIRHRFGFGNPGTAQTPFRQADKGLASTLMNAFMPEDLPAIKGETLSDGLPLRTWFNDGGVLICRPGKIELPFAAVIKGGHNAEHHNHNDLGSFSVVLGKDVVICDPGAEEYTQRTFSPRRYESRVLNSYGHSVPILAGKLQNTGRSARAEVLGTEFLPDKDSVRFDLTTAYKVPSLQKYERSYEFQRGAKPSLAVRDDVVFLEEEQFETALLTWSSWEQTSANELVIGKANDAVRVRISTSGVTVKISSEIIDEDVRTPSKPVRIRVAVSKPVRALLLTMTITPERK